MSTASQRFLQQHTLPATYLRQAERYVDPLIPQIRKSSMQCRPLMLGINGCQGSGKTTLTAYLSLRLEEEGMRVANLSLDDFYLDKTARQNLASRVHPLFATRGVPGTHNIELLRDCLERLSRRETGFALPRFDKATDNPLPQETWPLCEEAADVVLMEGWCWGARAVSDEQLTTPVNALEANEDPDGHWRRHVNTALRQYEDLYTLMHGWLMLQAPGFACVVDWRREQEHKLIAQLNTAGKAIPASVMSDPAITRFVAHYQRLTERLLTALPQTADVVWALNTQRAIEHMATRGLFAQSSERAPA